MQQRVNLKRGDLVRLKSGGPLMTIRYTKEEPHCACCDWFHGKSLQTKRFSLAVLNPAPSPA